MQIFSSTIIPTINRATLARAVMSILDQDFTAADFEVIVVNDSGAPLPDADWQHSPRVRVIGTQRRERSVARNTGAAIARGKYLHFLDDDDLLAPGALQAFWNLDQTAREVVWLYGNYQTVDNDGNRIDEFHPGLVGNIFAMLICGEAIPFQNLFLRAPAVFAAGAFDPQITGVEDRDLGRRIALRGAVAYTDTLVAKIRIGERGSSTNWQIIAEGDRWGREKALGIAGAYARMRASADSTYWHGRVSRALFASMVWNLQRQQVWTAASRAVAGLTFASWRIGAPAFWDGLRTRIH
jgi:glycosyltransferase involved in cell wall biosynthesis